MDYLLTVAAAAPGSNHTLYTHMRKSDKEPAVV